MTISFMQCYKHYWVIPSRNITRIKVLYVSLKRRREGVLSIGLTFLHEIWNLRVWGIQKNSRNGFATIVLYVEYVLIHRVTRKNWFLFPEKTVIYRHPLQRFVLFLRYSFNQFLLDFFSLCYCLVLNKFSYNSNIILKYKRLQKLWDNKYLPLGYVSFAKC